MLKCHILTRIVGLLVILILASTCQQQPGVSLQERNKDLVLNMNQQIWNQGDFAVIDEFYSPNFISHFMPDGSELKGLGALREEIKKHREAFPDWKEEINHIVAEGELVVIQFESTGTNQGSWLGNPPTGKMVRINEFSIFRIDKGKIIEQWLMPDIYNMRKQLGLGDP